jgi:hypothetical protein
VLSGARGPSFRLTKSPMIRFSPVTHQRMLPAVCLIAAAAGLVSCKPLKERMEITATREISKYAAPAQPEVASAVRFYDNEPDPAPAPAQDFPLIWETPPGWKEDPTPSPLPDMIKLVGMRFGEQGEGECSFSAMRGDAGGLEANVNRWRRQMGLPPITVEEIEKLPKKKFLSREAVWVAIDGDFKNMGDPEPRKNYRLVGLIQPAPEFTLFVKLTGPKDLVASNEAAFDQFCQSISVQR